MEPTRPKDDPTPCVIHEMMDGGLTHDEAFARLHEMERRKLADQGWYGHVVTDDPTVPLGFNAHTHGLAEVFGHPDLQVVLPVPFGTVSSLLGRITDRIKAGERFEAGRDIEGILVGRPVRLVAAQEGGRPVLRIILPDRDGRLDPGTPAPFGLQHEGTTPITDPK